MEIHLIPSEDDCLNGIPTTQIEVTVDITSAVECLINYDLLLRIILYVKEPHTSLTYTYEYRQLYEGIEGNTIQFQTLVIGNLQDRTLIRGEAKGIWVTKLREED